MDGFSSAHIYVRLPTGMTIDTIPAQLIQQCSQLTKANSIKGCKEKEVKIVYTMASNLKKTNSMEVGQVGFHEEKQRRYVQCGKKDAAILRELNKSQVQKETSVFIEMKQKRDRDARTAERKAKREAQKAAKQAKKEQKVFTILSETSDLDLNKFNHSSLSLHMYVCIYL